MESKSPTPAEKHQARIEKALVAICDECHTRIHPDEDY
jgi:hypothetical protein